MDNNVKDTNTTPEVNPSVTDNTNVKTEVNTSSVSTDSKPEANPNTDVNVFNPESLLGELPAESEVVTREDMAKIDVAATQQVVSANLGPDLEKEQKIANSYKEKMRQAELNYKPPSAFKLFLLFVFFGALIAFVLYLPEINEMVLKKKAASAEENTPEITTGRLICSLDDADASLNYKHNAEFSFTDNKLKKMKLVLETRGDITLDEDKLDELAARCNLIKDSAKSIAGATINCSYVEGKLTETQIFDLAAINLDDITAAFTEAGGQYPKYRNDDDISNVEKEMNASGYSCKKEAS